ncbi:MAG TPA: hypothetical protein VK092_07830 [Deinococcales bacterium]|nr:hypothetical protein [Deinococcales bacterium]
MSSFSVRIAAAGGTEAVNVDRMMAYAASQLGLQVSDVSCTEAWDDYRAVLSGRAETVTHLLKLVESAWPGADVQVRQLS